MKKTTDPFGSPREWRNIVSTSKPRRWCSTSPGILPSQTELSRHGPLTQQIANLDEQIASDIECGPSVVRVGCIQTQRPTRAARPSDLSTDAMANER
jgi:hypothetical protein